MVWMAESCSRFVRDKRGMPPLTMGTAHMHAQPFAPWVPLVPASTPHGARGVLLG